MKFDQIAFICANNVTEKRVKAMLGLTKPNDWQDDMVTMMTWLAGDRVERSRAYLQFNSTHNPAVQLELIKFTEGVHWHGFDNLPSMAISHVGFHLNEGEPWPDLPGAPLIQVTRTLEHTAKYLTDKDSPGYGRTYEYRIHHVGVGNYWKFIRRIPYDKAANYPMPEILK